MKRPIHLITAASLFVCSAAFGQKKKDTWIDPAKTAEENPDFLIQGEYGVAEKGQKWAVQAVALGDGKFDVYILEGGFPGLGYTREKSKSKISGTALDIVLMGRLDRLRIGGFSKNCKAIALEALAEVEMADTAKRAFA
ncbi:hypothetical protein OAL55_04560, partial [Verrucomicrobiales bacterium]|nr:hypothetical protein [Verrucomicrobiales bacterium]